MPPSAALKMKPAFSGLRIAEMSPETFVASLHFQKVGLVARPFAPRLSYRYAMFQPAPRPLSRIAREFVEAFREHNAALIREHSPYRD